MKTLEYYNKLLKLEYKLGVRYMKTRFPNDWKRLVMIRNVGKEVESKLELI